MMPMFLSMLSFDIFNKLIIFKYYCQENLLLNLFLFCLLFQLTSVSLYFCTNPAHFSVHIDCKSLVHYKEPWLSFSILNVRLYDCITGRLGFSTVTSCSFIQQWNIRYTITYAGMENICNCRIRKKTVTKLEYFASYFKQMMI